MFKRNATKLLIFLSVIGPGIITANVDNDAPGIATYSIVGAEQGYKLLWVLFLITFSLAIIQEMSARLGVVTGKGLADLIREQFSLRLTALIMITLLVVNLTNTMAQFAGIAASAGIFGIPKALSVIPAALFVWFIIVRGNYKFVERILLGFCLLYFTYIFSGWLARPDWEVVGKSLITPHIEPTPRFLFLFLATIGTTIAPWMQFYLQSSIVEKGVAVKNYLYTKLDVFFGAFLTNFVAFFIIIATAAVLHAQGIQISSAKEAALALAPLAGKYCAILFALGLLNASLMAACVLPLSTAYAISEAFGWESGVGHNFKEAKQFLTLYTIFIVIGAGAVLLPRLPLIPMMVFSQALNGMLLPVILIILLLLSNNKKLMGAHTNGPLWNIVTTLTIAITIVLSTLLLASPFFATG